MADAASPSLGFGLRSIGPPGFVGRVRRRNGIHVVEGIVRQPRKAVVDPAPSTISLIWTLLYPVIVASFGFVFVKAFQRKLPRRVALPFAVSLVANLLFMPIFAGLRSVPWQRWTLW